MSMEGIGLFSGIKAKMDYLNKSQKLVSENIANADTPGYVPKKLGEADFSAFVKKSMDERGPGRKIVPKTTAEGHFTSMSANLDGQPKERAAKVTYEVRPDGNAVVIEEQMIEANRHMIDYSTMLRVFRKNTAMLNMAVRSGRQ